MTTILSFLKKYDLTRIEKLQILNLLPRNPVEFYALVEECEERFTNDQIDVILNMIDTVVPLPPVPSEPEMAE